MEIGRKINRDKQVVRRQKTERQKFRNGNIFSQTANIITDIFMDRLTYKETDRI